ncbi:MAG: lysophospholipid acyltransferase family protein [Bdellovibrionales bacterium]
MARKKPMLRYALEAALVYPLFAVAWVLPTPLASLLGAGIGQLFYYVHPGTCRARKNLQLALPERAAEHEDIIKGMWRNMGRVLFEYPHLNRLWDSGRLQVVGAEIAEANRNKPVVFVAAHLANWEIGPLVMAKNGWDIAGLYRPPNNPFIMPLLHFARRVSRQKLFPKSAKGAMDFMRHVRAGGYGGVIMDQRLTEGVEVPFFGHPVLAPSLAAMLAVRYGVTVIPTRVERLGGTRQRGTVYPPLQVPAEGTDDQRITAMTASIYRVFEEWIRARPEQWLWMHDRWKLK